MTTKACGVNVLKTSPNNLMLAVIEGCAVKVEHCLGQEGCDQLESDSFGRSILMMAAMNGHEACTRLLLPKSDALAKSSHGYTALMLAAMRGHETCARLLLPNSDVLALDNQSYSALMWAAINGHEACVRLLLPVSDPKARSQHGYSALMLAVLNCKESCVRLLLPVSDPLAKSNICGQSASQMARDRGMPVMAELINAYAWALNEKEGLMEHALPGKTHGTSTLRM